MCAVLVMLLGLSEGTVMAAGQDGVFCVRMADRIGDGCKYAQCGLWQAAASLRDC